VNSQGELYDQKEICVNYETIRDITVGNFLAGGGDEIIIASDGDVANEVSLTIYDGSFNQVNRVKIIEIEREIRLASGNLLQDTGAELDELITFAKGQQGNAFFQVRKGTSLDTISGGTTVPAPSFDEAMGVGGEFMPALGEEILILSKFGSCPDNKLNYFIYANQLFDGGGSSIQQQQIGCTDISIGSTKVWNTELTAAEIDTSNAEDEVMLGHGFIFVVLERQGSNNFASSSVGVSEFNTRFVVGDFSCLL
jgi:hypothetical protein